jgi:hypothetical protein
MCGLCLNSCDNIVLAASTFHQNAIDSSGGGGLLVFQTDHLRIESCMFAQNSANRGLGGAVYLDSSIDVLIRNSTFKSNNAILGGSLVSFASANITIEKTVFENNTAQISGGGYYSSDTENVIIRDSILRNNRANQMSGSGVFATQSQLRIEGNVFEGNLALQGGGTVYWEYGTMLEPYGLQSTNTFSDSNMAKYGNKWASDRMQLISGDANNYIVSEYNGYIDPVVIWLADVYGQLVPLVTDTQAQLSALPSDCFEGAGYITGGTVVPFEEGVANISALQAFCAPAHAMHISVSASVELMTNFTLSFRKCDIGEYFADKICKTCEEGTFSLKNTSVLSDLDQASTCEPCPANTRGCRGDEIDVAKGAWRRFPTSAAVLACPLTEGACMGGVDTGNDLCATGYEVWNNVIHVL